MLEPQRRHMDALYTSLDLAGLTNRINDPAAPHSAGRRHDLLQAPHAP